MARRWWSAASVADVQDWPRRIAAVTAAQLREAAAAFLIRREAVTLYLTPAHA
ncbi:MAG: hypothetical protein WDN03_17905 [Rhizomicrobium sp.]